MDHQTELPRFILGCSSISGLPVELLQTIFALASEEASIPNYYETAKSLCLVCRAWNVIAQETPALWFRIDIRQGGPFVDRLLTLSRAHPLVISCDLAKALSISPHTYLTCLGSLSLAFEHVARWGEIRICAPSQFRDILWLFSMNAPILKSISVKRDSTYIFQDSDPVVFRGNCPQLDALQIGGVSVNWDSPMFLHIKSVEFTIVFGAIPPTPNQFLDILTGNPYLHSMKIIGSGLTRDAVSFRVYTSSPRRLQISVSIYKKPLVFAILHWLRSSAKTFLQAHPIHLDENSVEDKYHIINTLLPSAPYRDKIILYLGAAMMIVKGEVNVDPYLASVMLRGPPVTTLVGWVVEAVQNGTLTTPPRTSCSIMENLKIDQGLLNSINLLPAVQTVVISSAAGAQDLCDLLNLKENCRSLPELDDLEFSDVDTEMSAVANLIQTRYRYTQFPSVSPLKRLCLHVVAGMEPNIGDSFTNILGPSVLELKKVVPYDGGF